MSHLQRTLVWNYLRLIDSPDHSQIISPSFRSVILLSPDCCLGNTWRQSSSPITSPGISWKSLLSLEKHGDLGETLAGCVELRGTRRLTSSPFNDAGNVCLVIKPRAFFCLCRCIAAIGTGVRAAASPCIPLMCFSCSRKAGVWVRGAISTLLHYTTALINNSFPYSSPRHRRVYL